MQSQALQAQQLVFRSRHEQARMSACTALVAQCAAPPDKMRRRDAIPMRRSRPCAIAVRHVDGSSVAARPRALAAAASISAAIAALHWPGLVADNQVHQRELRAPKQPPAAAARPWGLSPPPLAPPRLRRLAADATWTTCSPTKVTYSCLCSPCLAKAAAQKAMRRPSGAMC